MEPGRSRENPHNYEVLPHPFPYLKFILGLVSACLLGRATLTAQPGPSGAVRGRIFNPASGVYVRDAEIRVTNTNVTAVSEAAAATSCSTCPPAWRPSPSTTRAMKPPRRS